MTDIEVKKEAKGNYLKREYLAAFKVLSQLPVDEFVQYAQGRERDANKWLTNSPSADAFWGTFLLAPDIFQKFFESDKGNHLLHLYFTQLKNTYPDLLRELALSCPELLVKCIRLSSAFLADKHFTTFEFLKNSNIEYLQLHYRVFE